MTDAPNAREREAHLQGMLLAAEAAESIAPSDEWSEDTKTSYVFGARDAARAIRKVAAMSPTPAPDVQEAVKAALEAAATEIEVNWGHKATPEMRDAIRALDTAAIIAALPPRQTNVQEAAALREFVNVAQKALADGGIADCWAWIFEDTIKQATAALAEGRG